jgi:hypothetical protein
VIRYGKNQAEQGAPTRAPGRYAVQVIEAVEGVTKKGDPKIDLRLGNMAGKTIGWDTLTFGDNPGIAHKKLEALGYDMGSGDEIVVDAARLVGLRCQVTFKEETYDGKTRLKPDFGATQAFGYESMKAFDAKADAAFDKSLPF